ncbi:hypothetical protein C8Q80DRAFT_1219744 [Daedaleopsis nitida]|nr:hypothetical protein C8Q80DRAFT_1219744 [Daedaleopsis nitida]
MDPTAQHIPSTPSSSRKRSRENETPSQRQKRVKAADRQRRKRERDRLAAQAGLQQNFLAIAQQQAQQVPPPQLEVAPPPVPSPEEEQLVSEYKGGELTAEDVAKRDRIRAAARERQRKHRALAKARKLRELGLDMGNEILPGMDEVQYRMNAEGQYQPVMPHEMPPHPHPQPHPMHEPPFPQGQPLGGQTFASTLLLSFSCAPLLKQHLLRTLSMTNEELASLEPIIAQAWDHWDQQVRTSLPATTSPRQFYHAAKPPDGSALADPAANYPPMGEHVQGHPYVHDPSQATNDFRARFHRPLVAPSPFRSTVVGGSAPADGSTQQQMSASAPPGVPSAPSASGVNGAAAGDGSAISAGNGVQEQRTVQSTPAIDPQLGQARDEAAGVAGKLERS